MKFLSEDDKQVLNTATDINELRMTFGNREEGKLFKIKFLPKSLKSYSIYVLAEDEEDILEHYERVVIKEGFMTQKTIELFNL